MLRGLNQKGKWLGAVDTDIIDSINQGADKMMVVAQYRRLGLSPSQSPDADGNRIRPRRFSIVVTKWVAKWRHGFFIFFRLARAESFGGGLR